MGDPCAFFCSGTPVGQGSFTPALTKDGRPYIRYSNSKTLAPWRKAVKAAAKKAMAGRSVFAGPLAVSLTFAITRPASHAGGRSWPSGKAPGVFDVDKGTRAILDALTKTVYYDDVQVVSLTARKVWALYDVDHGPGVQVWVGLVPGFTAPAAVQIG